MTEATIERLRLFLIESPIKMARLQGVGNVKGTVKRVLIELTSSDGVIGWGEAAPWEVFTGTPEAAFSALDIYLRPIVLGKPGSCIHTGMLVPLTIERHFIRTQKRVPAGMVIATSSLVSVPPAGTTPLLLPENVIRVKLPAGYSTDASIV